MQTVHFRVMRLIAVAALALATTPAAWAVDRVPEAKRVHVLIVVDTDDMAGATWGLDGKNVKAVVDAGLKKQKLDGRYTLDMLTAKSVTPAQVLKYYGSLKVDPDDALVFYYSGHGAQHVSRGHFLAFTHGILFRRDLLAAMQKHNPRLAVVLTDCCADYAGGNPGRRPQPTTPPSDAPPGNLDGVADIPDPPPDPGRKAPPWLNFLAFAPFDDDEVPRPKDKPKPPPAPGTGPANSSPAGSGVVLRTGDGPLPLKAILDTTDGEVMRHLFFRHTGVVDINGCQKGKSSHGTIPWGGSLFTIGFMCLQHQTVAKFDANNNGVVEWTEFFPHMQTSCERAGKAVGVRQVPEAAQLGQPVVTKR
jgi:hypothetical protein